MFETKIWVLLSERNWVEDNFEGPSLCENQLYFLGRIGTVIIQGLIPGTLQSCSPLISVHRCDSVWVCAVTLRGANCISPSRQAGGQMPLYRTPTLEIHPQEWRLHWRRLADSHHALPSSQRNTSLSLSFCQASFILFFIR